MDVVKSNLNESYTQLSELLPTAQFISFDEEMTGIRWNRSTEYSLLDTLDIRYQKMKVVASNYRIIQIGVCVFHTHPTDSKKLIARPYNFYVFPKGEDNGYNPRITMEAAAIHFNRRNHMDFQKWIYEGIPYLQAKPANQLARKLGIQKARSSTSSSPSPTFSPSRSPSRSPTRSPTRSPILLTKDDDKVFVNGIMSGLEKWIDADQHDIPALQLGDPAVVDVSKYQMPECNSFLRLALTQRIETDHPSLIIDVEESDARWKKWSILRLTDSQKTTRDREQAELKQQLYEANVGFRRVWELIYQSRVPLVGHNCLFDLMFAWSHFESDLPDTLQEFKRMVHANFPKLYDTKMIVHSPAYQASPPFPHTKTSLDMVYQSIKDTATTNPSADLIDIEFAPGFKKYADTSGGPFHEAAFDALATGYVFANIYRGALRANDLLYLNRYYCMTSIYTLDLNPHSQTPLYTYDMSTTHIYVIDGLSRHRDVSKMDLLKIITSSLSSIHVMENQMDMRVGDDKIMAIIHNPAAVPTGVLTPVVAAFTQHHLSLTIISWAEWEHAQSSLGVVDVMRSMARGAVQEVKHVADVAIHAVDAPVHPNNDVKPDDYVMVARELSLTHITSWVVLGVVVGMGLSRLWSSTR